MMNKKEKNMVFSINVSRLSRTDFIQFICVKMVVYSEYTVMEGKDIFFVGCGPNSCLVRVFLLEACDWVKRRGEFDLSVEELGKP